MSAAVVVESRTVYDRSVITALYPVPVETLLAVSRTVTGSAQRYRLLRPAIHEEFLREAPEEFERFDMYLFEANSLPQRVLKQDAVSSFLEHGPGALEMLAYLTEAMDLVHERFARSESVDDCAQIMFGALDVPAYLESLAAELSGMRSVHKRVQLHLTAATAEYVFRSPGLMLEHRRELDTFYEPLVKARDRFFAMPTAEALAGYIDATGELAKREHPMELYCEADAPPARQYEQSVERADSLLTELVSDELSLRLLEV